MRDTYWQYFSRVTIKPMYPAPRKPTVSTMRMLAERDTLPFYNKKQLFWFGREFDKVLSISRNCSGSSSSSSGGSSSSRISN